MLLNCSDPYCLQIGIIVANLKVKIEISVVKPLFEGINCSVAVY